MGMCAIVLAGSTLFLPQGETVRTDCFRGMGGVVPGRVAWAEVTRTEEGLDVWVGRRLAPGERPRASGKANAPESMFADGGETVEFALVPRQDDPTLYYHFIANPSNELYVARRRDGTWRPAVPVTSQVVLEEGRWGVRFVVPYAAVETDRPKEGDCWRASFAAMSDNWSGLTDYHAPHQFGTICFGPGADRATVESVSQDEAGLLHVTYVISPHRRTGVLPHKPVCGALEHLSLSEGDRSLGTFDIRLPDGQADDFMLDRYYCPASEQFEIVYRCRYFRRATVRIRRLDDDAVETFGQRAVPGVLQVRALRPGDYALELSDGQSTAASQFEVREASAETDPKRPFYPIVGSEKVTSEGLAFKSALKHRFTRLHGVGYIYDPASRLYGAHDLLDGEVGEKTLYRLAYEAQMVVLLQGKSGLESVKDRPGFYAAAYRDLKRAFPHLRFSIHVDNSARAADYARACDVFEYAAPGCSYAHNLLTNLHAAVASMQSFADGRPTVLWLGAAVPDNGKWRTAEELNTAVRYCVLKGVSGNVLHLGHGGVPEANTRLWSYMRGCEKAVNAWYPDWAGGEETRLDARADPGVEYGLRTKDGRSVLIAVNLDSHERSLCFVDPRAGKERVLRLPGCGSAVLCGGR